MLNKLIDILSASLLVLIILFLLNGCELRETFPIEPEGIIYDTTISVSIAK